MKALLRRKLVGVVLLVLASASAARGGEIPKGYRGVYQDAGASVRLELKESKAVLQVQGASYRADVEREDRAKLYEQLLKGKTFVYIPAPKRGEETMEVFWVIPAATGQKAEGGVTAYRAEVLYMRINREQPQEVSSLKVVFSRDGMVMLDTAARKWQVGWGAQAAEYDMRRVAAVKS